MLLISNGVQKNIPIHIHNYDTFFKRFRGLMFRLRPIHNEGIHLDPCNSIHMFFMFFPIDIVFLDKEKKIVALKENIKPWTLIFPIKNAQSALELPAGTISTYAFKLGDEIKMEGAVK